MKKLLTAYFALFQVVILIFNKNFLIRDVILFSVILWINYILFKVSNFNVKSPIFLFATVFNICNLFHVFYLANVLDFNILYVAVLGWRFSRETFTLSLLLNLMAIISIFTGILIGLKYIKKQEDHGDIDIILQNSNTFLIMGFLFYLVYILSYGGFWRFYSNLYFIRGGMAVNQHPLMQIIGNFRYVYYLGLFCEIHKLKYIQLRKNGARILFLIIIAFFIAFSSGGRFIISFIFIQLFLLTYNGRKIEISNIVFLIIFCLIVIIFFPIKWSFYKYLGGHYTLSELVQIYLKNSELMIQDLIANHMGSYSGFIVLLEYGRKFDIELLFKPITNLLSIMIPRRFLIDTVFAYKNVFGYYNEIINYKAYLFGEFHFNFLGYFYIVLGYIGIIIFGMFWGVFLGFLEKKYIRSENKNYPLYLYLYSSFVFMIAMNGSFDPYLRSLAYHFIGLWACLFPLFIKNSVLKRKKLVLKSFS